MGDRTCRGCKATKPTTEFGLLYGQPRPHCKACTNTARRARYANRDGLREVRRQNFARYGLTPEQYDEMRAKQDDRCAICRRPESRIMHGKVIALAVDHDHHTGTVRGLLCATCNTALGYLEKHSEVGIGLLAYLMQYDILRPARPRT